LLAGDLLDCVPEAIRRVKSDPGKESATREFGN